MNSQKGFAYSFVNAVGLVGHKNVPIVLLQRQMGTVRCMDGMLLPWTIVPLPTVHATIALITANHVTVA